MSEQQTQQQGQESPLRSERGSTTIQNSVVEKISGFAAQEVEGVRMGGGASRTVGGLLEGVLGVGGGGQTRGVSVVVGREEAAIDLTIAVEYGRSIPEIAEAVRRKVTERVENLTGLRVTEANIMVDDFFFPGEAQDQQQSGQNQQTRRVR